MQWGRGHRGHIKRLVGDGGQQAGDAGQGLAQGMHL